MVYKLNFWDYLFYTSMSIVLLWIILKNLGIIQTPFWLQYGLPASSFVIGVFALYYNLIKSITDLTIKTGNIEKDFDIMKDNNKIMDKRFGWDFFSIRHCQHPLRALIIDDQFFNIKEVLYPVYYKELEKKTFIFYTIKDPEWINWLQKVFCTYGIKALMQT